jgi:ribosome-binding factor A
MSQRVAKLESLIQQLVATELRDRLEADAAAVTVTRVDAAPDLRNATIWIGLLGDDASQQRIWDHVQSEYPAIQSAVNGKMTTKFVPRLHLRRDTGGEYAAEIDRLLRGL